MNNKIKTIVNGLKNYIDSKVFSSRGDWNQNDKSAENYIKNRPFYEEDNRTNIYLDERAFEFALRDEFSDEYYRTDPEWSKVSLNTSFEFGKKYIVDWDGVEYEVELKENDGYTFFGIDYYGYTGEQSSLPFGIIMNQSANIINCICTTSSKSIHTIGIYEGNLIVHQIDPKYLPNSFDTFYVFFSEDEDGNWSVDKTFDEITEAYNNFKNIIGVIGDKTYPVYLPLYAVSTFLVDEFVYEFQFSRSAPSFSEEIIGSVSATINAEGAVCVQHSHIHGFSKMDSHNPTGDGSFSMNRKDGTTIGGWSHAEGFDATASGNYSHAEGFSTTASGEDSHAEGATTTASGGGSHAEGSVTTASGRDSHAEGYSTIASGKSQHVQGTYNIDDIDADGKPLNTYAHIVGNGADDENRSNAHTLDWEGNAWFSGDVYTGSTSGTNRDEGSKKLITAEEVPQSDWNQNDETAKDYVKNRPFGETTVMGDTLTWDGNTEGLEVGTLEEYGDIFYYYRISESVPTFDEIKANGHFLTFADGSEYRQDTIMGQFYSISDNLATISGNVYFAYEDNISVTKWDATQTLPKKGIYIREHGDFLDSNIVSLTINGYNGFPTTGIDYLDPKYIKDMYYTGDPVETVVVEETTFELVDGMGQLTAVQPLEVGQEYVINLDGTIYNCIAKMHEEFGMPYIGNAGILGAGEDTGESFFIAPMDSDTELGIMVNSDALEYTVSVTCIQPEIHHIDPKYIKDMYYKEVYNVEVLPQSSLLFGQGEFDDILLPTPLIAGSSYTVNWNGVEYECIAESYGENEAHIENKDVPFFIETLDDGEECYTHMLTPGTGSFNISIYNNTDSVEVLPETSVEIESTITDRVGDLVKMLVEGCEYTVNWNGVEYKCIAKSYNENEVYIGNTALDGDDSSESDEPFYITTSAPDNFSLIIPAEEGTHDVHITGIITEYHTINRSYLPELVGASGTGEKSEIFNDYRNNVASGPYSHAEGSGTKSSGSYSHAEGIVTKASGSYSHSEGQQTTASGDTSHAEGHTTKASGSYSHSEGQQTTASGNYGSHAEGSTTIASGDYSHAEGFNTIASGTSSHAEGQGKSISLSLTGNANSNSYKVSSNNDNIKIGRVLKYNNTYAKIINYNLSTLTITTNKTLSTSALSNAEVILFLGIASGTTSHVEGNNTTASGAYSHAEGFNTMASGNSSHAEGYDTTASSGSSHAEGSNTTASGYSSHAEGSYTTTLGDYSHAEGDSTKASGWCSHAEGMKTKATTTNDDVSTTTITAKGYYTHAEGYGTVAYGAVSHAEGNGTKASGTNSHSEGKSTVASGNYSHAEGQYTEASGAASHAEGFGTTASGNNSHVEGSDTTASGNCSHSEGYCTVASGENQHVQGKFNIDDIDASGNALNTYAHIVGNGSSVSARSNAHTLDWGGNAWYQGTVEGTAMIVKSSTEGSSKRFKITVDDSGTISAVEI